MLREPSHRASGADLKVMRRLATALLGAMTLLFVAARLAPRAWPWPPFLAAFAEAGMVGAIADWFAVTALFRRPLGLPIPHTAIIPRNKDRIGEALGDFIAHNFLEPRILDRKLRDLEPAGRLARWLAKDRVIETLAARGAALAPEALSAGPALADLAAEGLRRLAQAGPLAPVAAKVLGYLWRDAGAKGLIDRLLLSVRGFLADRPDLVLAAVEARTWRWIPDWLDRALAERVAKGLMRTLEEMADPEHPLRRSVESQIEAFIARLADDPEYLARGEALKAQILADPGLLAWLVESCGQAARRLAADPHGLRDILQEALVRALDGLRRRLSADVRLRGQVDLWIRIALRRTVAPAREIIGGFVAQVVAGWDATEVSRRLELQVGRDLQFIRINGALVGGAVGLTIYVLARLAS
jgi:uncharacterized membrane-anchored protein YjiN (DUF445 family)